MTRVRTARPARRLAWLVSLAVVLAGCTSGGGGSATESSGATGSSAPGAAAVIVIGPVDGATELSPATPVLVNAQSGELAEVTVTDGAGQEVAGELNETKRTWQTTAQLGFGQTYTVKATAENADGKTTEATSTFSTAAAETLVFPAIGPLDGTTVGVGLPVRVYFDAAVTDRAAAQAALHVTAVPAQEGSWSWLSDTEVHWRPKVYWAAGTKVTVQAKLYGVNLGGGAWGKVDREIAFTVGESHVSIADTQTHQMQVFKDGQLVNTIPIAAGLEEPGRFTKNGVHVVIDKNAEKVMDSTTYGLALDAGGYVSAVQWATRISNNGEFVHSAPWSVADQGVRNVSHGCLNASPENAEWFFNFSQIGDVVEVTGSPVPLGPADGDIYDWTIPWEQWVAGSAL